MLRLLRSQAEVVPWAVLACQLHLLPSDASPPPCHHTQSTFLRVLAAADANTIFVKEIGVQLRIIWCVPLCSWPGSPATTPEMPAALQQAPAFARPVWCENSLAHAVSPYAGWVSTPTLPQIPGRH